MAARIIILYPTPTDIERFENEYRQHVDIYRQNLPDAPYLDATWIKSHPSNPSPYHLLVVITFNTMEDLKGTMKSDGMKIVGAHATEISTGGAPVIMIGEEGERTVE